MLYPKPCCKEYCHKEVVVKLVRGIEKQKIGARYRIREKRYLSLFYFCFVVLLVDEMCFYGSCETETNHAVNVALVNMMYILPRKLYMNVYILRKNCEIFIDDSSSLLYLLIYVHGNRYDVSQCGTEFVIHSTV